MEKELKTLGRRELDHLEWFELLRTGIIFDSDKPKTYKSATHYMTYVTRNKKAYRIAYLRQIYDPETCVSA